MFSQIISIPISSPNKNYFILYNFRGKLYYWKLKGKIAKTIELPGRFARKLTIPQDVLQELTEAPALVYKKTFLTFKYLVYEIKSQSQAEIIQRISHDMKNQVLMAKVLTDQHAEHLMNYSQTYLDQITSTLKNISSSAHLLSNFSHIEKIYKEEIELINYLQNNIFRHMSHQYFGNIKYEPSEKEINVRLDKNLFRIAFDNLLNNAIEEIKQNEEIEISVNKRDTEIIIDIANPFHNDNRNIAEFGKVGFSTKPDGSGIGLPVAVVIIEKHEGSLEYSVKDDKFIVEIILTK